MGMPQLLVTSQAGMRQVLLPVSISGSGMRQAFVGARGQATRFISVRQVTVGGTPFLSLPRLTGGQFAVRAVSAPTVSGGGAGSHDPQLPQDSSARVIELLTSSATPTTIHWTPAEASTAAPVPRDGLKIVSGVATQAAKVDGVLR